jgi:hypothetical protein
MTLCISVLVLISVLWSVKLDSSALAQPADPLKKDSERAFILLSCVTSNTAIVVNAASASMGAPDVPVRGGCAQALAVARGNSCKIEDIQGSEFGALYTLGCEGRHHDSDN